MIKHKKLKNKQKIYLSRYDKQKNFFFNINGKHMSFEFFWFFLGFFKFFFKNQITIFRNFNRVFFKFLKFFLKMPFRMQKILATLQKVENLQIKNTWNYTFIKNYNIQLKTLSNNNLKIIKIKGKQNFNFFQKPILLIFKTQNNLKLKLFYKNIKNKNILKNLKNVFNLFKFLFKKSNKFKIANLKYWIKTIYSFLIEYNTLKYYKKKIKLKKNFLKYKLFFLQTKFWIHFNFKFFWTLLYYFIFYLTPIYIQKYFFFYKQNLYFYNLISFLFLKVKFPVNISKFIIKKYFFIIKVKKKYINLKSPINFMTFLSKKKLKIFYINNKILKKNLYFFCNIFWIKFNFLFNLFFQPFKMLLIFFKKLIFKTINNKLFLFKIKFKFFKKNKNFLILKIFKKLKLKKFWKKIKNWNFKFFKKMKKNKILKYRLKNKFFFFKYWYKFRIFFTLKKITYFFNKKNLFKFFSKKKKSLKFYKIFKYRLNFLINNKLNIYFFFKNKLNWIKLYTLFQYFKKILKIKFFLKQLKIKLKLKKKIKLLSTKFKLFFFKTISFFQLSKQKFLWLKKQFFFFNIHYYNLNNISKIKLMYLYKKFKKKKYFKFFLFIQKLWLNFTVKTQIYFWRFLIFQNISSILSKWYQKQFFFFFNFLKKKNIKATSKIINLSFYIFKNLKLKNKVSYSTSIFFLLNNALKKNKIKRLAKISSNLITKYLKFQFQKLNDKNIKFILFYFFKKLSNFISPKNLCIKFFNLFLFIHLKKLILLDKYQLLLNFKYNLNNYHCLNWKNIIFKFTLFLKKNYFYFFFKKNKNKYKRKKIRFLKKFWYSPLKIFFKKKKFYLLKINHFKYIKNLKFKSLFNSFNIFFKNSYNLKFLKILKKNTLKKKNKILNFIKKTINNFWIKNIKLLSFFFKVQKKMNLNFFNLIIFFQQLKKNNFLKKINLKKMQNFYFNLFLNVVGKYKIPEFINFKIIFNFFNNLLLNLFLLNFNIKNKIFNNIVNYKNLNQKSLNILNKLKNINYLNITFELQNLFKLIISKLKNNELNITNFKNCYTKNNFFKFNINNNKNNLFYFLLFKYFNFLFKLMNYKNQLDKINQKNQKILKTFQIFNIFTKNLLHYNKIIKTIKKNFKLFTPKLQFYLFILKQNNLKIYHIKKKILLKKKKLKILFKKIIKFLLTNNKNFESMFQKKLIKKKLFFIKKNNQKQLIFWKKQNLITSHLCFFSNEIKNKKLKKSQSWKIKKLKKKKQIIISSNISYKKYLKYNLNNIIWNKKILIPLQKKIRKKITEKKFQNKKTLLKFIKKTLKIKKIKILKKKKKKKLKIIKKTSFLKLFKKLKFKNLFIKFKFKKLWKIKKINKINKRIKFLWEKKHFLLKNTIFLKKKSKIQKYIKPIFYTEFKKKLFSYENGILKNFIRFTKFYKLIHRKLKNKITKKLKLKTPIFIALKPVYKLGISGKAKTNVIQFIMQRRKKKEGFPIWQKYSTKWLRYSIYKNRINKFYFTPLRTKRWISTKKQKYLQIYKKLNTLHPRVGKWSTIGLVGNSFARNTLFIKKKILLKIFSNFYNFNFNFFKKLLKKFNNIYSMFNSDLTNIFNFFEKRIDVITFRSGFVLDIDLAKLLVLRGYIQINFVQKKNIHFRVRFGDFVSIISKYRTYFFEIYQEGFESFRNLYLNRFYKVPYFNILSNYINSTINNLTQMQGKHFWNKSLAEVKTLLDEYSVWNPYISNKNLYKMQLNFQINPINRFDKEIGLNINKPNNWKWFKKENKFLLNRNNSLVFNLSFFKNVTLKRIYSKNILNLIIRKFKKKKIIQKKEFFNLYIFKLIIKDLLIQTWEKFPKNLLINLKFRFSFFFQTFKIDYNFYPENINNNNRINFSNLRWLSKNF